MQQRHEPQAELREAVDREMEKRVRILEQQVDLRLSPKDGGVGHDRPVEVARQVANRPCETEHVGLDPFQQGRGGGAANAVEGVQGSWGHRGAHPVRQLNHRGPARSTGLNGRRYPLPERPPLRGRRGPKDTGDDFESAGGQQRRGPGHPAPRPTFVGMKPFARGQDTFPQRGLRTGLFRTTPAPSQVDRIALGLGCEPVLAEAEEDPEEQPIEGEPQHRHRCPRGLQGGQEAEGRKKHGEQAGLEQHRFPRKGQPDGHVEAEIDQPGCGEAQWRGGLTSPG